MVAGQGCGEAGERPEETLDKGPQGMVLSLWLGFKLKKNYHWYFYLTVPGLSCWMIFSYGLQDRSLTRLPVMGVYSLSHGTTREVPQWFGFKFQRADLYLVLPSVLQESLSTGFPICFHCVKFQVLNISKYVLHPSIHPSSHFLTN